MLKRMKQAVAVVVGGAAALMVSAAYAVPIDISTTATAIETDITHVVTTIGALLLVAAGISVAYKWGKGALFS